MSEIVPLPNCLLGIDVSHYQGKIDWPKVAESGVKFAFIKATEGIKEMDPMLKVNVDGARAAGIPYGLYHFWRPQDDAVMQANNFLRTATSVGEWEFTVALDIETGALDEEDQERAFAWLAQVDGVLIKAKRPLVYVSLGYAQAFLTDPAWLQYPLWIAHQNTEIEKPNTVKWPDWLFWQRQANGSIEGVTGPVDIDWFNGSESDFAKLIGATT